MIPRDALSLILGVFHLSIASSEMSRKMLETSDRNQSRGLNPPAFWLPGTVNLTIPIYAAMPSNFTYFEFGGKRSYQNYLSYSCVDDPSWTYVWPDAGSDETHCRDYAPGGINSAFCSYDVGLNLDTWTWTPAIQACSQSCGKCCQKFCTQNNFSIYSWTLNGIRVGDNFTKENCLSKCPTVPFATPPEAIFWMHPDFLFLNKPNLSSPGTDVFGSYIAFLQSQTGAPSTLYGSRQLVRGFVGIFTDVCVLKLISDEPGTVIHYTTDGSTPSFSHGTVYSGGISLRSSGVIQAMAFRPWEGESSSSAVEVVTVTIRTPVPTIILVMCSGASAASMDSVNGSTCQGEAQVEIRSEAGSAVWYTEDGSSPSTGRGKLLLGSVLRVSMYRSGVVRAVSLRDGAVESLPATGPYVTVLPPPVVASKFLSTVGLWTFSAGAVRYGPGAVWFEDEAGGLGRAALALSGTAAWTADGPDGVRFGPVGLLVDPRAMRGAYVADDVGAAGGLLLAGRLPARRLSVEVRARTRLGRAAPTRGSRSGPTVR